MENNPTLPIKKQAPIVEWMLKKANSDQLEFLNSIKGHHQYKSFLALIEDLMLFNMQQLFNYPAKDEKDLAFMRAGLKGEYAAFLAFIKIVDGALDEINRRKEQKY